MTNSLAKFFQFTTEQLKLFAKFLNLNVASSSVAAIFRTSTVLSLVRSAVVVSVARRSLLVSTLIVTIAIRRISITVPPSLVPVLSSFRPVAPRLIALTLTLTLASQDVRTNTYVLQVSTKQHPSRHPS